MRNSKIKLNFCKNEQAIFVVEEIGWIIIKLNETLWTKLYEINTISKVFFFFKLYPFNLSNSENNPTNPIYGLFGKFEKIIRAQKCM